MTCPSQQERNSNNGARIINEYFYIDLAVDSMRSRIRLTSSLLFNAFRDVSFSESYARILPFDSTLPFLQ